MVVTVVGFLKVMIVLVSQIMPGTDLVNWIIGASLVLADFEKGRLPSGSLYGAYTGLFVFLAPFYWLWTLLPLQHPPLAKMIASSSSPAFALNFLMRFPILLFDLIIGILLFHLVRQQTGSSRNGGIALCAWYLNPYNIYWTLWAGYFDGIPAAVLILAVLCGTKKQWVYSGLFLTLAGILRLFPFLALPFFLVYALRDSIRSALKLFLAFLVPLVTLFLMEVHLMGSLNVAVAGLIAVPLKEYWLLYFYGIPVGSALFRLTPFLLLVQLYLAKEHWRKASLTHLTTACLLVVMVSSFGGIEHIIWVMPFLAAYFAISLDGLGLFALTVIAALLFSQLTLELSELLPLFAGWLYGLEAAYLIKLNLEGSEIHTRLQSLKTKFLATNLG